MRDADLNDFADVLTDVMSYYGKDLSAFVLQVYFDALKRFDLAGIKRAFGVHVQDADRGPFAPKPADIVRLLEGGTGDRAMQAWSKVERSIRCIGPYESVIFDDPVIHAVIVDMGGWIALGKVTEKNLPFISNEFSQRYRGYAMRRSVPGYPRCLVGMVAEDQIKHGHAPDNPVLVGAKTKALQVYRQGEITTKAFLTRLHQPVDELIHQLDHRPLNQPTKRKGVA